MYHQKPLRLRPVRRTFNDAKQYAWLVYSEESDQTGNETYAATERAAAAAVEEMIARGYDADSIEMDETLQIAWLGSLHKFMRSSEIEDELLREGFSGAVASAVSRWMEPHENRLLTDFAKDVTQFASELVQIALCATFEALLRQGIADPGNSGKNSVGDYVGARDLLRAHLDGTKWTNKAVQFGTSQD